MPGQFVAMGIILSIPPLVAFVKRMGTFCSFPFVTEMVTKSSKLYKLIHIFSVWVSLRPELCTAVNIKLFLTCTHIISYAPRTGRNMGAFQSSHIIVPRYLHDPEIWYGIFKDIPLFLLWESQSKKASHWRPRWGNWRWSYTNVVQRRHTPSQEICFWVDQSTTADLIQQVECWEASLKHDFDQTFPNSMTTLPLNQCKNNTANESIWFW